MKVALVHDYLNDFGGAERVLKVLTEMYPKSPIYTAFVTQGSEAEKEFRHKRVIESKYAWMMRRWRMYSPLRFLLPRLWRSFDLSGYDLVITSTSSFIARGFKKGKAKVIAYCHTPSRSLYGYRTNIDWRRYWWARAYGMVVNTYLRYFDFKSAQEVDTWIANSENVAKRIAKFYRREAMVVYPPVDVMGIIEKSKGVEKQDYYLVVSRLVGAKGLEELCGMVDELGIKLKIVGSSAGYKRIHREIERNGSKGIELVGRVSDEELVRYYAGARGFIALARDEDFGMTVVEAMAAGTPVIAFKGGGFKETVSEGKTGVFVKEVSLKSMKEAIGIVERVKWDRAYMQKWARKFSREKFEEGIRKAVASA